MKRENKKKESEPSNQSTAINLEKEGAQEGKAVKGTHEERLASVANAIDKAIENIGEKLKSEDGRGSVGDLVKLIQLRKELMDEAPKQVTVRWVDEWNSSPAKDE